MKNRSDKIELLSSEPNRLMDARRRDAWKIALTILLPLIGYYCFEIIPQTGIVYKEWTKASPEEGDLQRENWRTGFRLDQRSTRSKTGMEVLGIDDRPLLLLLHLTCLVFLIFHYASLPFNSPYFGLSSPLRSTWEITRSDTLHSCIGFCFKLVND